MSVRSSRPPTCAGPTVLTSAWHSPQRSSRNVNAASTSPVSSRSHSSPMASSAPAASSSSSASRRCARRAREHRDPAPLGGEQLGGGAPHAARARRRRPRPGPRARDPSALRQPASWPARCAARERLAGGAARRARPTAATRPAANTSRTSSAPACGPVDEAAGARVRAWRRAGTRTARRRGSSGSRRARRRGGSWRPSRARDGRRAGARAGSARRGPTRACRGRRRDRRRALRSKFVITSTHRANTSSAARWASRERGRDGRRPRRRRPPATSAQPRAGRGRGGP